MIAAVHHAAAQTNAAMLVSRIITDVGIPSLLGSVIWLVKVLTTLQVTVAKIGPRVDRLEANEDDRNDAANRRPRYQ